MNPLLQNSCDPILLKEEKLNLSQQKLHEEALLCAKNYRQAEAALLEIIMKVDACRLYRKFALNSTFTYCIDKLTLSESVAYNFINVARKSQEIPELKIAIQSGQLSITKARTIVPVLTTINHSQWITKAVAVSKRQLEKEVQLEDPLKSQKLILDLSPNTITKFQTLQAQLGKNKEQTLNILMNFYLSRDKFLKQSKAKVHSKLGKRTSKAAGKMTGKVSGEKNLRKQVLRRDGHQCQATKPDGTKCLSTQHLHVHHLRPKTFGGTNAEENLIALCSSCHRTWHRQEDIQK